MEILNLMEPESFKLFLLVLVRVSVVLFLMPVFSTTMLPALPKAGLAMVISLLVYSVVGADASRFPETALETGIHLGMELMLGLFLGLSVRMFFGAVQLAGQVIGFQMGFSMINVVDPQSGASISIMEEVGYWVTVLIFLAMNGHHILILALIDSFALVKPGLFVFQDVVMTELLAIGREMFVLAVTIGAPVIAALIFTNAAFGLTAKFSPQMNVMIVSFPVMILAGLALFGVSLQISLLVTARYVEGLPALLRSLLFHAGGG